MLLRKILAATILIVLFNFINTNVVHHSNGNNSREFLQPVLLSIENSQSYFNKLNFIFFFFAQELFLLPFSNRSVHSQWISKNHRNATKWSKKYGGECVTTLNNITNYDKKWTERILWNRIIFFCNKTE